MIVAGSSQKKAGTLCRPRQSPVENSPGKNEIPTIKTTDSGGCCRRLNDCTDLEREVLKQKELRIMYRKSIERTQDYLKYCLQVAQENGFLGLIIESKDDQQGIKDPLSTNSVSASITNPHQLPTHVPRLPNLAFTIDQAKMNGWYIESHEIEFQEKIGQGSTADIYRAIWRGFDVAVKCIFPDFFLSNENGVNFFAQELDTLSRQRHPYVLQLLGACIDPPNNAWVVTEILGMTLKEWLHGPGSRRNERSVPIPPFHNRVIVALEIAQAMQYLHEHKPKVIHRDLKPSNIFLDDSNHVRVADFGHARFLDDSEMALTGTYVYMAPEVIRCEPYNEKSDVYSFAVILNELVTGNYPYIETDFGPSKIAMEVAEGKLRPMLPHEDNDQLGELINLISQSWDQDASGRPSFARITSSLRKIQHKIIEDA
ncbi:hypothetical protein SADUNF_Sadunf06G0176300 [Salix dunnii]|uniref:Protein kinase domain-containing protein n=1 Tax=Salix dunnii TaxID=1413687 RepID=A0A835K292_9ROSI|nr:hypothetical protein SADUNF_Sadunf06G0176300 [Salix dunnii]